MRLTTFIKKKNSKGTVLFLSLLLSAYSLNAQSPALPDTMKMSGVTVTALSPEMRMPFRTVSVDTMLREWNNFTDIGKLIQISQPVFLKRYGTGGLATLSLRGMSGSHTCVTWNGLNINAPMNGQTDFTLLPVFVADEMTLTFGGANLNNLSGSIGGSLDISSSQSIEKGLDASVSTMAGGYGRYGGALAFSASSGKFSVSTRIWGRKAENNFWFINENGDERLRRENAAMNAEGILQDLCFNSKKHSLSAHLWYNDTFRELPAPITSINQQNLGENQTDKSLRSVLKYGFSGSVFKADFTAGYVNDVNIYEHDPANIYNNLSHTLTARSVLRYFGNGPVDITFSTGNEYQTAFSESYTEEKHRNIVSSSLSVEYKAGKRWMVLTQLREQMPGSSLSAPEFTSGVTFKPGKDGKILIKVNISRNMKFPNLNDLFWNPGGNTSLKPEVSRGGELGFVFSGHKENALYPEVTTTFYASRVKDLILWAPVNPIDWAAKNLSDVNIYGAEFTALTHYTLSSLKLKLSTSYTYTKSVLAASDKENDNSIGKQLIYTPVHTLNVGFTGKYRCFEFGTAMTWNSRCFTVSDNSKWLEGYFLTDFLCGVNFNTRPAKIDIDLTAENIFNETYFSVEKYPMPLRSFSVNFILKPNFKK